MANYEDFPGNSQSKATMTDLEIHFNAPKEASQTELAAYLDEACGDDIELRARVEALFVAQYSAGAFMGQAPMEDAADVDEKSSSALELEEVGNVIGNYKLLQKIGEGGFGDVYMADQLVPVKRRVAFKIIKLGMDTKQVVARFEVERQALAMMDHPNIAKVYDAGATDLGPPYFVMELVRGITVTRFCDEQKLNTEARLALFMDVCSAIQHAHQKGIIHRDLKPSNVIVTLHDDKAVPKVIDFGVAKATQQDLTDKTLFTKFEQFIGTPAYMSPEQAQMSGLDIDTRSDIYALGVLLYELLTGTTPFDSKTLAKAGQDEIRRVIREEDPPRPSTRLTELQKRTVSRAEVHIPDSAIDQDLDWIVMKALEKDRTRRYETANGLAMDIRRHLANEPVEAAAPSAAYRFKKYARRHRAALGTAAVVAGVFVAATAISIWQAIDAGRARFEAQVAGASEKEHRLIAEEQERIAKHRFVEELLDGNKTALGIAHLAQLIREKLPNYAAAGRLMSAFQMRDFPRIVNPFPTYSPAFSPDGSLVHLGGSSYDFPGWYFHLKGLAMVRL
jgi:tRNA A-37 threonylcarbamoyl transferase component Bud32